MTKPDNVKSRVMFLADTFGTGRRKMAENIGMTYSNFTGKARQTPLNSNAIANILSLYPDVNAHWLLTGDGEMLTECAKADDAALSPPQMPADVPQWLIDEHRTHNEIVLSQQRSIEKLVDCLSK